jgi:membrane associated rhomboid family serine protease
MLAGGLVAVGVHSAGYWRLERDRLLERDQTPTLRRTRNPATPRHSPEVLAARRPAAGRLTAVIPIHDLNPTRRFAWVTLVLIVANVAVFLLWQPTFQDQQAQQEFFFCHAEIPWEVSHQTNLAEGGAGARSAIQADYQVSAEEAAGLQELLQQRCPGKRWLLSVLVAMFLHGGWLHIAGNMLFLWVFGNNVEDRLGRPLFVGFYLLGGVAAAALQLAFDPSSAVPSLGASGAVAAVLGAYLVMFPRARVVTLVVLLFFITAVELPAVVVLGAWFVLQLFSGVGGLGAEVNAGVAYWAHVGGFVFGLGTAALLFRGRGRSRSGRTGPERPRPALLPGAVGGRVPGADPQLGHGRRQVGAHRARR